MRVLRVRICGGGRDRDVIVVTEGARRGNARMATFRWGTVFKSIGRGIVGTAQVLSRHKIPGSDLAEGFSDDDQMCEPGGSAVDLDHLQ
jgi:hypothetical protein